MDDVRVAKTAKARQIERLVQERPDVAVSPCPAKQPGNGRIERDEGDLVAVPPKLRDQRAGLHPLAAQDVQAECDQRDSRTGHPPLTAGARARRLTRALISSNPDTDPAKRARSSGRATTRRSSRLGVDGMLPPATVVTAAT